MSRLLIARILIVVGFAVGLESLYATFTHIGDPTYTVTPEFGGGETHAWYHALREVVADIATIIAVLFVFFAGARFRNETSWWLCLIILIGYYAPFWVGMPFNDALRAPDLESEIRHIVQAVLPLAALLLVRRDFFAASRRSAA